MQQYTQTLELNSAIHDCKFILGLHTNKKEFLTFAYTYADTMYLTSKQKITEMVLENDWLLSNPVVCQKKKLSSAMSKFVLVQLHC